MAAITGTVQAGRMCIILMSFDAQGGIFPFTLKEMELLNQLLREKVSVIEQNLKSEDGHEYVNTCMLMSKTYVYIKLMKSAEV